MDMNVENEKEGQVKKKLPAGYYFCPLNRELVSDFLLKHITALPLDSDGDVKVRDGVELLDPEQHHFDEFTEHIKNMAYYITDKAERKTEGGGSETRAIIKTTTGYWRGKKEDITITKIHGEEKEKDTGADQIIGYKKSFAFFNSKNDKTSWRMDEITVNPETVPADVRGQTEKVILCVIRVKQPKTPEEPYNEYEESDDEEDENEE